MKKMKVGVIGCGNISPIYLKNISTIFGNLELAAIADIIPERAKSRAEEYKIPKACTVAELLADPAIDAVLNITIPPAHAEVCSAAIAAGKHVYVEKPLSITLADGERIVAQAKAKGVRIGCAPDTFLGAGIQTCRKLIDDGWIGTPVGATAFMLCGGHESWHPDPAFYYKAGGGPMFDMGPYYLTALLALLGPVARIAGLTKTTWKERTITSAEKFGQKILVEVPTHVSGLLDFASGASATIVTSFDVKGGTKHPPIEIYGSEGTMIVPDPNTFGGPVLVKRKGASEYGEIPLLFPNAENSRGLGLSDMAEGIATGSPHRASGDLALHVLEIMSGIHTAAAEGKTLTTRHQAPSPAPRIVS
jgi:predicted dehydrogenase